MEQKREEQYTNSTTEATCASNFDTNVNERNTIADNSCNDDRCIEMNNGSTDINNTNCNSTSSEIDDQTCKSGLDDRDISTSIKSIEDDCNDNSEKETKHTNNSKTKDNSMKQPSEFTKEDNERVSSHSVEEKADWPVHEEEFVLMDDVITVDDNYYGEVCRSEEVNSEDIRFDVDAELSGQWIK